MASIIKKHSYYTHFKSMALEFLKVVSTTLPVPGMARGQTTN
jgi:hypothetical protein